MIKIMIATTTTTRNMPTPMPALNMSPMMEQAEAEKSSAVNNRNTVALYFIIVVF